jgi:mono/diheme cytochrome c family protein
MKKLSVLALLIVTAGLVQNCSHPKTATQQPAPIVTAATGITYKGNIEPLMVANCSPCHMPPKGNKRPYNSYTAVKNDVDEILERIQKNPGERGFMPARHANLSDSTIQLVLQWKAAGLPEGTLVNSQPVK